MAKFNNYNNHDSDKIWNMDQLFIERIDLRIGQFDEASINANQVLRYRILYNLYIGTHFKFPEEEIKILDEEFIKVKNTLNSQGNGQQHKNVVFSIAEKLIDDLHKKLLNLLYEAELIGLKKKIGQSPEVEVENDY